MKTQAMIRQSPCISIFALLILTSFTCEADIVLVSPQTVTASSTDPNYAISNLVNSSSLVTSLGGPGEVVVIDNNDDYPEHVFELRDVGGAFGGTGYMPNPEYAWRTDGYTEVLVAEWIRFTFNTDPGSGGNTDGYDLDGFHIWNNYDWHYGQSLEWRGIASCEVWYSTDHGTNWEQAESVTMLPAPTIVLEGDLPTNAHYVGDTVEFGDALYSITDLEFRNAVMFPNGDWAVGMNEIRFIVVPEPGVVMLIMLGLLSAGLRRG